MTSENRQDNSNMENASKVKNSSNESFVSILHSELFKILGRVKNKEMSEEIQNLIGDIYKLVKLGDAKDGIKAFIMDKIKESNLFNVNEEKIIEEKFVNFEKVNENKIKEFNASQSNDERSNFTDNLLSRVFFDGSFSQEQTNEIYNSSVEVIYRQYKGEDVSLSQVFMEAISKSDNFNEEEKKKLDIFSKKAEKAVGSELSISSSQKEMLDKRIKQEEKEKWIESLKQKEREEAKKIEEFVKQNGLDGILNSNKEKEEKLNNEREAEELTWEQKINILAQNKNDMYFMNMFTMSNSILPISLEKQAILSDKISELSKKIEKDKGLDNRADVILKAVVSQNNVFDNNDKELIFEAIDKHSKYYKNDKRDDNINNVVKEDVLIKTNGEKPTLNGLVNEFCNSMNSYKKTQEQGAQAGNDMFVICMLSMEVNNMNISKEQNDFLRSEMTDMSDRLKAGECFDTRADVMLKNAIDNSGLFNQEDKNRVFYAIDKYEKDYKGDIRKGYEHKTNLEDKKETFFNNKENNSNTINLEKEAVIEVSEKTELEKKLEKVEKSQEYINLINSVEFNDKQKEAIKLNMANNLQSQYIENAKSIIIKEDAPIGFAYTVLCDMDKDPSISKETKDKFLKIAMECSKEVRKEGKSLGQEEGVYAFAEKIGKKMLEDKEFGAKGIETVKDFMQKGDFFNKFTFARTIKDTVLNSAENKDKKVENENIDQTKSIEESLVDNVIKSGKFSKETENEILNISVEVEQARLKGDIGGKETYSEVFMDKVINNKSISEEDKNKLFEMAVKTENKEIADNEGGKRLYFDENKMERFNKLKLRDEVKEALDIKVEDGKFSVKIPEDNNIKKEVINSIKVQEGIEKINKMNRGEKVETHKDNTNNMTLNMSKFLTDQKSR